MANFPLFKDTLIGCRVGENTKARKWNEIAHVFIGSKNQELKAVYDAIQENGRTVWNGATLTHPDFKEA